MATTPSFLAVEIEAFSLPPRLSSGGELACSMHDARVRPPMRMRVKSQSFINGVKTFPKREGIQRGNDTCSACNQDRSRQRSYPGNVQKNALTIVLTGQSF